MATTPRERTGSGWLTFAGIILIVVGFLDVIDGLWALDPADTRVNTLLYADKLGGRGWLFLVRVVHPLLPGMRGFYAAPRARRLPSICASNSTLSNPPSV